MKCVILCGGQGIRMGELAQEIPKTLLKIGNKPVICRLMDHYAKYGVNNFILCLGHLGNKIREYFAKNPSEYKLELVDTGEDSTKVQRLLKIKDLVEDSFYVSYGDDLSDINLKDSKQLFEKSNKIAMLTVIQPQNPYGILKIDDSSGKVMDFEEKPKMKEWINGGYFIFSKKIFDYFNENEELEKEVFKKLAKAGELIAFKHLGYWKSMNNPKDYKELNDLYELGELK